MTDKSNTGYAFISVISLALAAAGYVYYAAIETWLLAFVFGAVAAAAFLYYAVFICGSALALYWFVVGIADFAAGIQFIHFHKFRQQQYSDDDKIRESLSVTEELRRAEAQLRKSSEKYEDKAEIQKSIAALPALAHIQSFCTR